MSSENFESSRSNQAAPPRRWLVWLRRTPLVIAVLLILLGFLARFALYEMDHGVANGISGSIFALAAFFLFVWILLLPRLSGILRLLILAVPIALIFAFMNRYEFTGFSGEMIPQFRVRGPRTPLVDLDKGAVSTEAIASTTGDKSVSSLQFLGNQRNGIHVGPNIASDWAAKPPKILWKQPVGAGWAGMSIKDSRVVTLEQRDSEEWVSCYDLGSGKLLWKHVDAGKHYEVLGGLGPRTTPTIDGDWVYALSATGIMNCLQLESGQKAWSRSLLEISSDSQESFEQLVKWGRAGSPLVNGDNVIVPLGAVKAQERSLISFNKKTGETQWIQGTDQISYVSPSLVKLLDRDYIASINEQTATLHEAETGKQVWSFPWPGQSNGPASCSQPVAVGSNRLLLTKGYGEGAACLEFEMDAEGQIASRIVWKSASLLRTKFTSALLYQDHAFALCEGVLECVRLADGKRVWKGGRFGHGQMLLVGDKLLVSTEDGDLVLLEASTKALKELGRLHVLEGIGWNYPSVAGKWVLMRTGSEMACVELPVE